MGLFRDAPPPPPPVDRDNLVMGLYWDIDWDNLVMGL